MSESTQKVLLALDENPELLLKILGEENDALTRGGVPGQTGSGTLINIMGEGTTVEDLKDAEKALEENPVVQLYLASAGSLDVNDLVNYCGGVSGQKRGVITNMALKALLSGKLDLKVVILVIVLLKLFKRKNQNTYSNSAIGLLGSLMGANTSNNSGLFSGLLGGNNYSSGLFGSSNFSNSSLLNGIFGNNYTASQQNNSILGNLLNFVNGGYNSNPQYNQMYNILNSNAGNIVGSNGMVSASGLFSVLSQLMGF